MSSSVSSELSATKCQKVTPIPKGATIPMIQKSIPSYENIEVEEATLGEVIAASLTVDVDTYKPYEDEPIATEEWVCEYQRKARDPS